jgi:dipeptidase E
MKLFLTSTGLSNTNITDGFLKILNDAPEKMKALIVAYGQNDIERFYIEEAKKKVGNIGINTVVLNMNDAFEIKDLPSFNVICVCGGNTFSILDKMREVKIDDFIKSEVGRGAIYFGVSAGSIIAGPSIEIAGWGIDGDENEIGLKDLKGFGLTDIAVFPHFDINRQKEEIEDFKKKAKYPIQELTDKQAFVIMGSEKYLIHANSPWRKPVGCSGTLHPACRVLE